jgi:hypothetical protein
LNGFTYNETENHQVELNRMCVLELNNIPDIGSQNAIASLQQLRLA